MAALGLPGLSGFAGEFLILIGTWQTQPLYTLLALVAVVLASVYMLKLFQSTMHGTERVPYQAAVIEMRPREMLLVAPLLAAIIFLGVWPGWLNDRTPSMVDARLTVDTRSTATSLQAKPHVERGTRS